MWVYENRASTILHHILAAGGTDRPWILPANVCPVVPLTFLKLRCPFELLDIEPTRLCLDPRLTLDRVQRAPGRYAGVLFVRTYGVEDSFDGLFAELKRQAEDLLVIDDRCLCWPAFEEPGSCAADVVLYSTGYAKRVDLGFGGHAWLRDGLAYEPQALEYHAEDLNEVTAAYKDAIASRRRFDYVDTDWLDGHAPELEWQAYRERVDREIPRARAQKERINAIYRDGLPEAVRLADDFQGWRFQIRVPDKIGLLEALFAEGQFASSHYAPLTGIFAEGLAPASERLHADVVNLFNDAYYTDERAERTVEVIRRHLAEQG